MSNLNERAAAAASGQQMKSQKEAAAAAASGGSGNRSSFGSAQQLPPCVEDPKAKDAPNVMDPLLCQSHVLQQQSGSSGGQQMGRQQLQQQYGSEKEGHSDTRQSPAFGSASGVAAAAAPAGGSGFGNAPVPGIASAQLPSTSSSGVAAGKAQGQQTQAQPVQQQQHQAGSSGSSTGVRNPSQAPGRSIDDLLMFFARCPVEHNHPRPIIGHMHMYKAGPVLTVQHDEHMTRVFAKLVSEGFLSAPVLDEHRRFIGFVDMLDITTYTVSLFEKEQLDWNQSNWEGFWARLATFRGARVKDVMSVNDWYRSNPYHAVKKGFSLLHAMEVMAREGIHRVAVLDERDQVVGISTQSMIISLISQNANLLGTVKDLQVREMHGGLCDTLLSVKDTQRAIDAFRLMADKRVSGLAVVNNRGALVDVISARDLRCMGTDGARWWRLFETVHTFKMLSRLQFPQQTPRRPLYVMDNEPFTRVLEIMDDGNIHRVIEVKDMQPVDTVSSSSEMESSLSGAASGTMMSSYEPVYVISQRDVIRFVLKLFGMPVGSGRTQSYSGVAAAAPSSTSSSSSSPLPSKSPSPGIASGSGSSAGANVPAGATSSTSSPLR